MSGLTCMSQQDTGSRGGAGHEIMLGCCRVVSRHGMSLSVTLEGIAEAHGAGAVRGLATADEEGGRGMRDSKPDGVRRLGTYEAGQRRIWLLNGSCR